DYYPGRMAAVAALLEGYPFDVLLGSVHWIGNWMFDDLQSATQMGEWDTRSVADSWRAYAGALEELSATGACDVLAHPDLVKVAGHYPDRGVLEDCEQRIAEAAGSNGLAAEVSSAGLDKPCRSPYPSRSLLERFSNLGVPITLASDSHGPSRVGHWNTGLGDMAAAAGYLTVRTFKQREPGEMALGEPA
ncbi:MAG: hypothetical protein ACRDZT_01325, partial [Acidimicrobiales bacterium]